jgi:hypothetical protein
VNHPRLRGPREIAEDEARGTVAATYERLREALGIRFVPTAYRMLALYEPYLTAATDALADLIAGDEAERFAIQVRTRARRAAGDLPATHGLSLGRAKDDVVAILEGYSRANPRNLLFTQALLQAAPAGPGDVMVALRSPPPETDDPDTILADILESHGGLAVPGLWRELAEFPDVLGPMWRAVRASSDAVAFQRACLSVGELARAATELTEAANPPDPRALGLGSEEAQEIEHILNWFVRLIAVMIVEIEYLRLTVRD